MTIRNAVYAGIGLVMVLACIARVVHLDADPYYPTWIGYITDEGRWNEIARNLVLFGSPLDTPLARLNLTMSPGYQAVNYLIFLVFGVDFWTARLFSAASGIALMLMTFLALRRHVTPFALALGVAMLGFETNLLAESRMALPEVPSVLSSLAAYLMLVLGRATRTNALIAGLFAATAIAMKGTSILVILFFPCIVIFNDDGTPLRARFARTAIFLVGLALPLAIGAGLALFLGLLDANVVGATVQRFFQFLAPAKSYTIVMRFFNAPELESRNVMLLGAWFCAWIWLHRGPNTPPVLARLYLTSGAWAAWWLLVWSGNDYLPGRYVVHLVVPATIHFMAGASIAQHTTLPRIASAMSVNLGWRKALSLACLVLPSAIFVAAVLDGVTGTITSDGSRLALRLTLICLAIVLLVAAAWKRSGEDRVVAGFLVAPILLTIVWVTCREVGLVRQFWVFDSPAQLAVWALIGAITFASSFALAKRPRHSPWVRTVQVCAVALIATIFITRAAPAIFAPTYSFRDASLDLQQQLSGADEIRSVSSSTLFLGNRLRYRDFARGDRKFDALVILEHHTVQRKFLGMGLAATLIRTRSYELRIHPMQDTPDGEPESAVVAVYQLR